MLVLWKELIISGAVWTWRSIDPFNILWIVTGDVACQAKLWDSCLWLWLPLILLLLLLNLFLLDIHWHLLGEESFGHSDRPTLVCWDQIVVGHINFLVGLRDNLLHNTALSQLVLGCWNLESVFRALQTGHVVLSMLRHWCLVSVSCRFWNWPLLLNFDNINSPLCICIMLVNDLLVIARPTWLIPSLLLSWDATNLLSLRWGLNGHLPWLRNELLLF